MLSKHFYGVTGGIKMKHRVNAFSEIENSINCSFFPRFNINHIKCLRRLLAGHSRGGPRARDTHVTGELGGNAESGSHGR